MGFFSVLVLTSKCQVASPPFFLVTWLPDLPASLAAVGWLGTMFGQRDMNGGDICNVQVTLPQKEKITQAMSAEANWIFPFLANYLSV